MTTSTPDASNPTEWSNADFTRLSIAHMAKSGELPPYVVDKMSFIGLLTEDNITDYHIDENLKPFDEKGRFMDGVVIGLKPLAFAWIDTDSGISAMRTLSRLIEKPVYPVEVGE